MEVPLGLGARQDVHDADSAPAGVGRFLRALEEMTGINPLERPETEGCQGGDHKRTVRGNEEGSLGGSLIQGGERFSISPPIFPRTWQIP